MSLDQERKSIEAYFNAEWNGATPIGFDGHAFEPSVNSVRLTIKSGSVLDGSIGRVSNRKDHIGILTVSIFTAGGAGSVIWRGYAQTIEDLFHEKTLTTGGIVSTAPATAFVRFSPPEMGDGRHPYIAAEFDAPPFHQTNVICPYVRYQFS